MPYTQLCLFIILFLLAVPLIQYLYLTLIPPLFVIFLFLSIVFLITYPVYFIQCNPHYFTDQFRRIRDAIMNKPRWILWHLEMHLHLRTRDVYPGLCDEGVPTPRPWPANDLYNRPKAISGLWVLSLRQKVWDWRGIPYGYKAEQIRKNQMEGRDDHRLMGSDNHDFWGKVVRWYRGEEEPQDESLHDTNGMMNNPIAIGMGISTEMTIWQPPPPICTCTTTCVVHPIRYELQRSTIVPAGSMIMPPWYMYHTHQGQTFLDWA
ncbi:uncharacterized protein I303_101489 [Kwoniella dejecticola CBS 10117]|uniref:Uncharacterized protein n=1 Tax=Kwoniella dejecticola CBS 10117 TaxID=1296121 RepID=A0A1A6ADP7_9TREE|nr:uncharacterized protein I303_02378 [Kwoniella dejecticola CBS 10117]OBR88158.1 hypothetical protein I303_02378 [Kwoniella dejecticola CBS 10117]